MFNEIKESIGIDKIEKAIQEIDITKTILINIDKDKLNVLVVEKTEPMEHIEELINIKKRIFYVDSISSNKAVVIGKKYKTPKMVTTANKYALAFNMKIFKKKLSELDDDFNEEELLELVIQEYYQGLNIYTKEYDEEKRIFLSHMKDIAQIIKKHIDEDKKVRIFIEKDIDDYKKEFDKYFSKKIFDEEVEDGVGFISSFISVNRGKKPLLMPIEALCDHPQIYKYEDAVAMNKLRVYMGKKFHKRNKIGDGEQIRILYNPKDKVIEDFEYNPYLIEDRKERLDIIVTPIINKYANEYKIETSNKLVGILNGLAGFALTREDEHNSDKKKFYNSFKNAVIERIEKDEKVFFIADKEFLKANIFRIMDGLIEMNSVVKTFNKDGFIKMANIINLELFLEDKFGHREESLVKKFEQIQKGFKDKVENYNNLDVLESKEEIMFATGQVIRYVNAKGKGKVNSDALVKYTRCKSFDRIEELLANDMEKYAFDIHPNGREARVFGAITASLLNYSAIQMDKELSRWLRAGIYGNNCLYKSEAKSGNNNESEKLDAENKECEEV